MAWNQSSSNYSKKSASGSKKLSPAVKGVLALIVVWALGSLVWWFIAANDVEQPVMKETKAPEILEEVKAAKAGEVRVSKPKHFWEVDASQTNGFTEMQMRKWKKEHRPPPGYTNNTALTEARPQYAIFDTYAENEIACYLTMSPGETLVGTPYYSPRMRREFLEALDRPVEMLEDDTPEQRALRLAVRETKEDLKKRMREGEDVFEIMLQTRNELQELARYKSEIEVQLREFREKPGATVDDLDDFVTAANSLLAQKGIAPLQLGVVTRRMLEHNRSSRK